MEQTVQAELYDIAVIGGGPAGMAAALEASADAGNRVLLIERAAALGGILCQCTHTGFGLTYFGQELTGQEYARRFIERIESSHVEVLTGTTVLALSELNEQDAKVLLTLSGEKCGFIHIKAKAAVLASGCRERPIGALQTELAQAGDSHHPANGVCPATGITPVTGTRPAGIFTAGAAQKMININGWDIGNRFVILGSGDVGLIVARQLAESGKEVIAVIEKSGECGGTVRNRVQCLEKNSIPLMTYSTVSEVHGVRRISGVDVIDLLNGSERFIACDTLITSVGLIPERELLEDITAESGLPDWVFLCGNACYVHDTADDVTAEAEKVGRLALRFVRYSSAASQIVKEKDQGGSHGQDFSCESNCGNRGLDYSRKYVDAADNTGSVICTACPKSCAAVKTESGWHGLKCGRNEPVV